MTGLWVFSRSILKSEVLALSPLDEKGAERIEKMAPVDQKDTWTICVYIVGSNLEDDDEDDLSALTKSHDAGIQY